jgi:acetyltransferase-like isoleucine patch superfamily enzyme
MMPSLAVIADRLGIEIKGILDHHYWGNKNDFDGIPVIGDERWLLDKDNTQAQQWLQDCVFFPATWPDGRQVNKVSPDMNSLRLDRIQVLEQSGAEVINLIHPEVNGISDIYNSKYATTKIGKGVLMQSSTYVGPNHNVIGDYCQIEVGAGISHDAKLGRNVGVAPMAFLCDTIIKDNAFIGAYATFDFKRNSDIITIGENSTVWTRAVVNKDVPDNSIYTDNNRIFKKLNERY